MVEQNRPLEIHQKFLEFIDSGRPFVLALILKADGSTPQKAGVKAIIEADGKIWGTLGGGAVEAEAQRRAREVCESRQAILFDMDLADAHATGASPICGGTMRILLDPTVSAHRHSYKQAAEALQQRRRGALLNSVIYRLPVEVKASWIPEEAISADTAFPGADAIRSCLENGTPKVFTESTANGTALPSTPSPPLSTPHSSTDNTELPDASTVVLVEPVIPMPLLLIVGGGHIGQALSHFAVLSGFDVLVIDDRSEFANPSLFADGVKTRCADFAQEAANFSIGSDTFIVLVTRGHKQDSEALQACIHRKPAYLGMIGSKRKVAMICQHFIESGIATQEEFSRVFAPIGLDISAVTVPEIAISIMAQIIAVRRKGATYSRTSDMATR